MMFALLVLGCTQNETYPDAYASVEGCADEPSEECEALFALDFGDPRGVLTDSLYALAAADPWFYNMAAALIDETILEWPLEEDEDAEARFDNGTLVVYDEWMFEGLVGASLVVHEAAHGRPRGRPHIKCPSGIFQCDRHLGGAVDTQLQFLELARELDPEDELLEQVYAVGVTRLLVVE